MVDSLCQNLWIYYSDTYLRYGLHYDSLRMPTIHNKPYSWSLYIFVFIVLLLSLAYKTIWQIVIYETCKCEQYYHKQCCYPAYCKLYKHWLCSRSSVSSMTCNCLSDDEFECFQGIIRKVVELPYMLMSHDTLQHKCHIS